MVHSWEITIPELTGDEPRRAYVYLPESYKRKHWKRYPVLYMFDGHNLFFDEDASFGTCWGLKKYLDRTRTEIIIAAVECNHDPDNGRLKEYSPYDFSDPVFGTVEGRGKTTMEWMVHCFKPFIDHQFRTLSARRHTFIAGSSMGGLMSLYALMEYNHIFSRAAALSPSLWVDPDRIRSLIRDARLLPDTVLYMDYGSQEFSNHAQMEALFVQTVQDLMQRHIYLTSRVVPHGEHSEACWEKQLPLVFHTLLYRY